MTGLRASNWRDLGGGFTTNLALQVPGQTLVARVHPATTCRERVRALQAARQAAAAAGVPAVEPLALLALPDGRQVELEPFVEAPDPMRTPRRLVAGAPVLARLHDALRTADLPPAAHVVAFSNHVPAPEAVSVTAAAVERLRAEPAAAPEDFAEELLEHVGQVAEGEAALLAEQVEHLTYGDFWDGNVLLSRGEVAAVLDFGFLADRARVDDVALPFWFWLLEPGHGLPSSDDVDLLVRIADAYDAGAQQPLSDAERASLPLALARQPAWAGRQWLADPRPGAVSAHARKAAAELPVAQHVLAHLGTWQNALTRARRGP
nr:phosphotransferase [Quadrisphaera sp. RL12-1S]